MLLVKTKPKVLKKAQALEKQQSGPRPVLRSQKQGQVQKNIQNLQPSVGASSRVKTTASRYRPPTTLSTPTASSTVYTFGSSGTFLL